MADSAGGKYLSLPQYERCFHLPRILHPIHYPPPSSYNKDNIEELLNDISISRRKMFDEFYEKIDDVYFPLVYPIAELESRMKELKLKVDLAHKTIHMQQLEVTKGEEAINIFICTWFEMSKKDVDTCFQKSISNYTEHRPIGPAGIDRQFIINSDRLQLNCVDRH